MLIIHKNVIKFLYLLFMVLLRVPQMRYNLLQVPNWVVVWGRHWPRLLPPPTTLLLQWTSRQHTDASCEGRSSLSPLSGTKWHSPATPRGEQTLRWWSTYGRSATFPPMTLGLDSSLSGNTRDSVVICLSLTSKHMYINIYSQQYVTKLWKISPLFSTSYREIWYERRLQVVVMNCRDGQSGTTSRQKVEKANNQPNVGSWICRVESSQFVEYGTS